MLYIPTEPRDELLTMGCFVAWHLPLAFHAKLVDPLLQEERNHLSERFAPIRVAWNALALVPMLPVEWLPTL